MSFVYYFMRGRRGEKINIHTEMTKTISNVLSEIQNAWSGSSLLIMGSRSSSEKKKQPERQWRTIVSSASRLSSAPSNNHHYKPKESSTGLKKIKKEMWVTFSLCSPLLHFRPVQNFCVCEFFWRGEIQLGSWLEGGQVKKKIVNLICKPIRDY